MRTLFSLWNNPRNIHRLCHASFCLNFGKILRKYLGIISAFICFQYPRFVIISAPFRNWSGIPIACAWLGEATEFFIFARLSLFFL